MKKMKTLTVSGQTYAVSDPEAVHSIDGCLPDETGNIRVVDNSRAGAQCWSGKHIVELLCPPFSETAPLAICTPVAGYPLEVVSKITPVQSGTGDPSPDNICPIAGHTAVSLTISNGTQGQTFTCDLGQTVYGGLLDWATGVLTVNTKKVTLTGKESWGVLSANPNTTVFTSNSIGGFAKASSNWIKNLFGVSSHFVKSSYALSGSSPVDSFYWTADSGYLRVCYGLPNGGTTAEEFNQFLAEQYAKGTPVEFVCQIEKPVTVQLTPQEISALAGENTLCSDAGETQVTGRADLVAVINKLTDAVSAALAGNQ